MQERLLEFQFQVGNTKDVSILIEALEFMMAQAIDSAKFEFQGSVTLSRLGWAAEYKNEEGQFDHVVLVFLGPKSMAEQFFETLSQMGKPYSVELMAEKLVLKCSLIPPPPQDNPSG